MMAVLRALVATCEKNFMAKNKNDLDALKAAVFLGPHASSPIDMRKISYIPHHIINADGAPTAALWTRLMADTRDAEIDATYSQEELDKLGPEMRDYLRWVDVVKCVMHNLHLAAVYAVKEARKLTAELTQGDVESLVAAGGKSNSFQCAPDLAKLTYAVTKFISTLEC